MAKILPTRILGVPCVLCSARSCCAVVVVKDLDRDLDSQILSSAMYYSIMAGSSCDWGGRLMVEGSSVDGVFAGVFTRKSTM